MRHALSRSQLLDQVEGILLTNREPLHKAEIAKRCGVHRSTISRLEEGLIHREVALRYDDDGRWYIDRNAYLTRIKLRRDEALALYLAARLLSRHSDEHNPHVVGALEKLATALGAKSVLMGEHIEKAARAVRSRKIRREYVEALEVLAQAWEEGRKVRLRYRSAKNEVTERVFAPYFLEPSGIGYACYVIGYDERRKRLATFKVERISEIQLTDEPYTIADNFDPHDLLTSAWGVIWRDAQDYEVVLRFASSVVQRVKESVWHHSQRIEDLADGSCLFTVRVGSTLELKPWVRGWGSAVEVLAPPHFREEIIAEVREMARRYGEVRQTES